MDIVFGICYFGARRRWTLGRMGGGKGILGGTDGVFFVPESDAGALDFISSFCTFSATQSSALVTVSPILVSGNFISPMLKSVKDFSLSTVCPADLTNSFQRVVMVSAAW